MNKLIRMYRTYIANLRERALLVAKQSKHADFIDEQALRIAAKMLGHKGAPTTAVRELADDLITNSYR